MSEQTSPAYGVGSFCWNELYSSDLKKAAEFYQGLVGWKFTEHGQTHDYHMIMLGDQVIGGAMDISKPEYGGMPSCWGYYIDVQNCDDTVARQGAGGSGTQIADGCA